MGFLEAMAHGLDALGPGGYLGSREGMENAIGAWRATTEVGGAVHREDVVVVVVGASGIEQVLRFEGAAKRGLPLGKALLARLRWLANLALIEGIDLTGPWKG